MIVWIAHAKVGNRQALNPRKPRVRQGRGAFSLAGDTRRRSGRQAIHRCQRHLAAEYRAVLEAIAMGAYQADLGLDIGGEPVQGDHAHVGQVRPVGGSLHRVILRAGLALVMHEIATGPAVGRV